MDTEAEALPEPRGLKAALHPSALSGAAWWDRWPGAPPCPTQPVHASLHPAEGSARPPQGLGIQLPLQAGTHLPQLTDVVATLRHLKLLKQYLLHCTADVPYVYFFVTILWHAVHLSDFWFLHCLMLVKQYTVLPINWMINVCLKSGLWIVFGCLQETAVKMFLDNWTELEMCDYQNTLK